MEHLRSVRTPRYKYIRNYLPKRPHLQPCAYKDAKSILIALREWNEAGRLDETQMLLFAPQRPGEELYDLDKDPHEVRNLAADPAHREILEDLRGKLGTWMEETGDRGRDPEPSMLYDSDMKVYVDRLRALKKDPSRVGVIEDNIALMKRWAMEGK